MRLKNKLGTKQLPTAELLLHGSLAYKISEEGRGVPCISDMLTITRFHNSISAAGVMRRILSLAQDYCLRRSVFGKLLVEHPLHMQTLARIELETRAAFLLTMKIARLLGKQDCNEASNVEAQLLRLLTPITKLYTAKQVLPIWEGTTNVLSLDVLRSISKSEGQVLKAFHANVTDKLSRACASRPALKDISEKVQSSMITLLSPKNYELLSDSLPARDLAFSLARIYMASLLIEHASWEEAEEPDIEAAKRWCQQDLTPVLTQLRHNAYDAKSSACDLALVMKGHADFTRT